MVVMMSKNLAIHALRQKRIFSGEWTDERQLFESEWNELDNSFLLPSFTRLQRFAPDI